MKQSGKKLARGQMVYAPIASTQSRSRSPFVQSKKNLTNSKTQPEHPQQQSVPRYSHDRTQRSPQSPYTAYDQTLSLKQSPSPFHQFQQQLQQLVKENTELKARQEIYISKLLKLQEGLERQHQEFMNLQELYNELFNVYKQKEQEIAQCTFLSYAVHMRFRETERSRVDFASHSKREPNISTDKTKSTFPEQTFKHEIAQLIFQNERLNKTNEKLISELNYIKSKSNLHDSRQTLQQKVYDELNDWQKIADLEKQSKIKLDYENKFLKIRNQDLQKTIAQLEKIVALKQTEIIKMRQEKFAHRRQSSEKVLGKSPPKSNLDSARSKGSNQENKKFVKLIENLQKQNHRLREQNLLLKEKAKASLFQKQATTFKLSDSFYSSGSQNYALPQKRLEFSDHEEKHSSNPLRTYQNQNFNSQNINQQYFSFSRQRQDRQSQDLPSFPMDLQIEGLIKKHEEDKKYIVEAQQSQPQMVEESA